MLSELVKDLVWPAERALINNHGARLKILEDLRPEFEPPSKQFYLQISSQDL